MSLNSIFQYFVPKDKKFFPLFEQASQNLINISHQLVVLLNEKDEEKKTQIHREIKRLEHVGDDVKHQIILELGKNFITPFDREDIHALATSIDDVANYIYETSSSIECFQIGESTQDMVALADLLHKACKDLHKAVSELKEWKNIRNVTDSCVRIGLLETQADHIYDRALAQLFQTEKDAIKLIKYKEILANLETATDMCEDAASVMESILVKHA